MKECYVSIDVEADGPIPVANSMLQLGAVAFAPDGEELGWWQRNFEPFPNAKPHPKTMEQFWGKRPQLYEQTRIDQVHPGVAMREFRQWLVSIVQEYNLRPVAIAYPAGFDFTWVHVYFDIFCPPDPFGFACLDIKTLAMAAMNLPGYRQTVKRNMPAKWFEGLGNHNHVAVEDAREQGQLFFRIMNAIREERSGRTAATEAIGWAHADACATLDRGEDPRQQEVPDLLERAYRDLELGDVRP